MSNFYEELSRVMSDGMTVNITISKKGEKLNVLFTAIPKDKKKEDVTPFVIRGTGAEIDVAHDSTALVGTAALSGMTDNSKEFLKKAGAGDAKSGTGPGLFDETKGKDEVKTTLKPKQEVNPPQQTAPASPPPSNPTPAPTAPPASTDAAPAPPSEPTAPPAQTGTTVEPNKEFDNQGPVAPVTEGEKVGAANMEGLKQAGQQPAAPVAQPAAEPTPPPQPPSSTQPANNNPSNQW